MRPLAAAIILLLSACAPRRLPPAPPLPPGPSFVDLQPGWRVQVLTPILKSGAFLLKPAPLQEQGNTLTLRAGDEFQGYETAIYVFSPSRKITLTGITRNHAGQLSHPPKPLHPRLLVPARLSHVRLLFTRKISSADHNMAILAAPDPARLEALTRKIQSSPATACRISRRQYCEWIPAGIAVRPERPEGAAWLPAR
jgi:hypothetical protein